MEEESYKYQLRLHDQLACWCVCVWGGASLFLSLSLLLPLTICILIAVDSRYAEIVTEYEL